MRTLPVSSWSWVRNVSTPWNSSVLDHPASPQFVIATDFASPEPWSCGARGDPRDVLDCCEQGRRLFDSEGLEHRCAGLKI
jgi:hypothetical protein